MRTQINQTPWFCPECGSTLDIEECDEVKELLNRRSQVELRCEHCGEGITADTTDCAEGLVDLNLNWVYE